MSMFIKIDTIDGECTADKHEKEIELVGFNHSMSQPLAGTRSSAGGATSSKADHGDFAITKKIDIASPGIAIACVEGTAIKKITITLQRDDGDNKVDYMQYIFDDCVIASYNIGGGGDALPIETATINYGVIKWDYVPQKEGGGGSEGHVTGGWDVIHNKKV